MDQRPRCQDCGEPGPLTDGVCTWRAGCEHRQLVQRTRMADLDAFLATRPAGPRPPVPPHHPNYPTATNPLAQLFGEALVRVNDEARNLGLLGPDEEIVVDFSDLLLYRRDDG